MQLKQINVAYEDHMGTDMTVVNAARASFNKQTTSTRITKADISLLKFLARGYQESDWQETAKQLQVTNDLNYIMKIMWELKNKATHFAPFCHPTISIRITTPLAIARQLWKSHIGVVGGDVGYAAWSEESRRYLDNQPEFFMPRGLRHRAENVKQGSGAVMEDITAENHLKSAYRTSSIRYRQLLESGTAPEQSRFALPTGMMVSWTWTGSLAFWARICMLRMDPQAQQEAQDTAYMISDIIEPLFPVSWQALTTGDYKSKVTPLRKLPKFLSWFKKAS